MDESFAIRSWPARPGVVVIRVEGRLDARSSAEFLDHCRSCLASAHLVVNLSKVNFLSSSGVGALLVLIESARESGRQVRIAPTSEAVSSVLEALNLQDMVVVHGSEYDALGELDAA